MPARIRIATFNLENLDDKPGQAPALATRIALMRPQLVRLNADILCLQEVNGQEEAGGPRRLSALAKLLDTTSYVGYQQASTMTTGGTAVYDERNLVILSRLEIISRQQLLNDRAQPPRYRKVTAIPPEEAAKDVKWERPLLYAKVQPAPDTFVHLINVHLKSRLPSPVVGQQLNNYQWKSASGWAEGFFLSAMKRMGQALETRMLIDSIFAEDEQAKIVVCGDFNATLDEVPLAAIRGEVEDTGNPALATRVMVPCELSIPESARYSLLHRGRGAMIDHLLISKSMLQHYRGTEILNEILPDKSGSFASDKKFPESDHAPLVAEFEL